jgi:hypothetical protein
MPQLPVQPRLQAGMLHSTDFLEGDRRQILPRFSERVLKRPTLLFRLLRGARLGELEALSLFAT